MNPEIIRQIENEQLKDNIPEFGVGDTVRVYARIKEGNRERVQMFEGVVIKRQNGGIRENFTVRRVAYGVGTEKTWPLHSPVVEKISLRTERVSLTLTKLFVDIAWLTRIKISSSFIE